MLCLCWLCWCNCVRDRLPSGCFFFFCGRPGSRYHGGSWVAPVVVDVCQVGCFPWRVVGAVVMWQEMVAVVVWQVIAGVWQVMIGVVWQEVDGVVWHDMFAVVWHVISWCVTGVGCCCVAGDGSRYVTGDSCCSVEGSGCLLLVFAEFSVMSSLALTGFFWDTWLPSDH